MQQSAGSAVEYPGPLAVTPAPLPDGKPASKLAISQQNLNLAPGAQTLVQPKVLSHLSLAQEIPLPNVVIWTPEKILAKTIVPPPPQKPAASDATPSLQPPNEEMDLADLAVSSTHSFAHNQAILPRTTSPIIVRGPQLTHLAPVTTSEISAQPTPAAVTSLSDHPMSTGAVILPPVNETAPANSSRTLPPGRPGNGNPTGVSGFSKPIEAKTGTSQRSGSGSDLGDTTSTDRITLPKNGQFGVVVVGSSLEGKYPETAELWTGRLAYSVFLHVGLTKSWILQYSLPRSADAEAAGSIARIEAPWPYNIVRPSILPGEINADALMVHGFVNRAGRFEGLAIAFPPEFAQAQFVLSALQQWQFRPATQNGQLARVEVLLIIPEVQ